MKLLKIIFVYLTIFILFTAIYLFSFHTPIFSFQKVLFYRGVLLLFSTFFLFGLTIYLVNRIYKINIETLIAAIIISFSINLSLFVVLPVTFERSVTMYLLNTLKANSSNSCHGLTKIELEKKLIDDYVIRNKAIDKRINEQKIISFLKEQNDCLQLNLNALNFLKYSKIIGKIYGLK